MVISSVMVIVGIVAMLSLPTSQVPDIVPPEILVQATYPGADAKTLEAVSMVQLYSALGGGWQ